ncbi:MAG TPA: hypothetical protein VFM15_08315 [Gammaproteobacteria bacterium]|nr:hypothetical protein [Gammaproteobacteria bacterium]
MNFTLLIHETPELFAMRGDPARRFKLFAPIDAYIRMLCETGVFGGGAGLEPPDTSTAFVADGQRLARVKTKIHDAGIAFEIPRDDELSVRLDAVLVAIYAAYGSGWDDVAGAMQQE